MDDDFEKPEKLYAGVVPEQYKPYNSTELTDKQIEYAREYLKENEKTRRESLWKIKRFVKKELSVFSELDEISLLAFLRSRKFDFEQTCSTMKNFAEFLKKNQSDLIKIDTEILHRVIESKAIGFLPYRDAKGRALGVAIAENWDPADLKAEDIVFGSMIALHATVENPVNQVSGYVVIVNFKNVSFMQFRKISSWILAVVNLVQNCYPSVIKEIHIIHTPTVVLLGWNIVKTFLNEYTRNIITFYDSSNWEQLHEKIPPCILPEEFGGHLGPFSNAHWGSDIKMIRKHFFDSFNKILKE